MGDNEGWKIYKFPEEELSDAQLYDDREWPHNGKEFIYHRTLALDDLKEGLAVICKGNPYDNRCTKFCQF